MIVGRSDRDQTVWDGNTYKRCFRPGRSDWITGADLMWLPTFPALGCLAAFIVNSDLGPAPTAIEQVQVMPGCCQPAVLIAVPRMGARSARADDPADLPREVDGCCSA